jgi:cytochrome c biogenesis protein CcdA
MKKLLFAISLFFIILIGISVSGAEVFVSEQTTIHYFYSFTCLHCAKVHESGILEAATLWSNVNVNKYEVSLNQTSRDKFEEFSEGFRIPNEKRGYPFLVIEQGGNYSYLMGDLLIIENLENSVVNFQPMAYVPSGGGSFFSKLSLVTIIASALIDSINPCAFGVLLFLMAVMLSMGSSKRAFRAGMIYTFVIFLVYLSAGFGIMKLFTSFSTLGKVKTFVGVLIFIGGLIEIKDFFFEGKGISLRIPVSAKPILEKYSRKGTLVSLIILGILVAMVELPCTGGIYLAILSLISTNGGLGIFYLILYNFIFVLPLILITYFVSKGVSTNFINSWVQSNKKWMRLAAGIIMIFLAIILFGWI